MYFFETLNIFILFDQSILLQDDFQYVIKHGNEEGLFELIRKYGVWALHFRHRLKTPQTFHLEVEGRPNISQHNRDWEKPLVLRLKIIVVP